MFKDIMVEVRVVFVIVSIQMGNPACKDRIEYFRFFFLFFFLISDRNTTGTAFSLLAKKEWPQARATEYLAVYRLPTSHFSVYLSDYHWCVCV